MKFGSVCSGIEAASVAWHPLGWSAAWFAEIEPFPCAVLSHHYPEVPNLGDMSRIPAMLAADEIEAPDILCGGTPCQAFSVAGQRRSLDDARGNLSLTFCIIADELDAARSRAGRPPGIIFWENVPGVLTTSDNAFGCFLAALAGCDTPIEPLAATGWTDAGVVVGPARAVAWRILDAQFFGLAQRRRRVFVVASAREGFDPAAVLLEFDGVRRDLAPSREAGEGTARGAADRAGGNSTGGDRPPGTDVDTADSLQVVAQAHAFDARQSDVIQYGDKTGPLDTDGHTVGVLAFDTTQITSAENRSNPQLGDPCCPLAAGAHAPAVAWSLMPQNSGKDFKARQVEVLQPLMAGGPVSGNQGGDVIQTAMQVRRLTPRECERLQGLPDDYTLIPWRGKSADQCPDGPRYKALGNSWAVPVVRWIGRRIEAEVSRCP